MTSSGNAQMKKPANAMSAMVTNRLMMPTIVSEPTIEIAAMPCPVRPIRRPTEQGFFAIRSSRSTKDSSLVQVMNGFNGDKIPGWLLDAFDERTTLPHGPLDRFPIPLEGEIIGGRVLVPKSGTPARYIVNVACAEEMSEALRFLSEYLPLSGYIVFGEGSVRSKRNLLSRRKAEPFELLLIRRPPFVGTVLLSPREGRTGTLIEADIAHPHHPESRNLIDFTDPRSHPDIHWRNLEGF